MSSSSSYSEEDIERAMGFVARVIDLYGDAYWPIFERLEAELLKKQRRSERLQVYARHDRMTLNQG